MSPAERLQAALDSFAAAVGELYAASLDMGVEEVRVSYDFEAPGHAPTTLYACVTPNPVACVSVADLGEDHEIGCECESCDMRDAAPGDFED